MPLTDHLLTTAQARGGLGVSLRRVQAMVSSGMLPATLFGRAWMIRSEDVDRLAATPRPQGWKKGRKRGKRAAG